MRVGIKKVDRDGRRECVQRMRWDERERNIQVKRRKVKGKREKHSPNERDRQT
jgi:hypothetical protein